MLHKGYIGQALLENLSLNGVQLVTKANNKHGETGLDDMAIEFDQKTGLIETVKTMLRELEQIEPLPGTVVNDFVATHFGIAAYLLL